MQESQIKIAVIGAGPAGLSAAYMLKDDPRFLIHIYEADSQVGGMAKSISLWGQTVDLGPHRFFSDEKKINELWLKASKNEYRMVNRLTRIFYQNKFFYYPLKPFNALTNLGIITSMLCLFSYIKAKIIPRKGKDFESWVSNRFGYFLFKIFFKTYSEKLWGISCKELDQKFAQQRIKKLSLLEAILNGFRWGNLDKHKTLADKFAYPIGGAGKVYENMAQEILQKDHKLFYQTPIAKVIPRENGFDVNTSKGDSDHYQHVISTMPLTLLVKNLSNTPTNVIRACDQLNFRNTILVYLKVDKENLFSDQWIYIHSDKVKVGRITNFKNWVSDINHGQTETILALEYWCQETDADWKANDVDLIARGKSELVQLGLADQSDIMDGYIYRLNRCYPVYANDFEQHLAVIQNHLDGFKNLHVIGRYGAFKYNNQDHSLLMGMLCAENIQLQTDHNLWNINTDDDYQEKALITEAGLVS